MSIVLMGQSSDEEILNLLEEFQEEEPALMSRLNFKRVEAPGTIVIYVSEAPGDDGDRECLNVLFRDSETARMGNLLWMLQSTTTTTGAEHAESVVISHDLGIDSHRISVKPKR